jgi:hypothetical protein
MQAMCTLSQGFGIYYEYVSCEISPYSSLVSPSQPFLPLSRADTCTGTAVYLFAVEPNLILEAQITTLSILTFQLDGNVGHHLHVPDCTTNLAYDVSIHTNSTLQNGLHPIVVSTIARSVDDRDDSLLLFECAKRTYIYVLGFKE